MLSVDYSGEESAGVRLSYSLIARRFVPVPYDIPICLQERIGALVGVKLRFQSRKFDQIHKIVGPASFRESSRWELIGFHQIDDDARFQCTLNGVSSKVVGSTPSTGSQQRLGVADAIPCKPLKFRSRQASTSNETGRSTFTAVQLFCSETTRSAHVPASPVYPT